MHLIHLTGGIASGKSSVRRILLEYGICCIDGDGIARKVVEPGTPTLAKVQEIFPNTLLATGELDRKKLGAIVFNDAEARKKLEDIVHPAMEQYMLDRLSELYKEPFVYYESIFKPTFAPIYCTLEVRASKELRLNRLMRRNSLTETEAMARINAQPVLPYPDYVIENDFSGILQSLESKVLKAHIKILTDIIQNHATFPDKSGTT